MVSDKPETVRLFLEVHGGKLEWWDTYDGTDIYVVELTDGTQHLVRNIGGNIACERKKKCPQ